MNNNLIGEQITQYRKALNMTQEELGKAVGERRRAGRGPAARCRG